MSLRGVFGGTFDPIHFGHLRCAWEVAAALDMPVHMIPAREPPHRSVPVASPEQRWDMLELALAGQRRLLADDRELKRPGPSFMVDTLASLATEFEDVSWCLIIGADAAAGLAAWHRWRAIVDAVHLVIMTRPGKSPPGNAELDAVLAGRAVERPADLARCTGPAVLRLPVTALDISASEIRRAWRAGQEPRFLTPSAVHDYIARRRIYAAGE